MKLRSIASQNSAALVKYLLLSSLMTVALIAGVGELSSNMAFALIQFPSAPQMVAVMREENP